ncbi:pyruvate, water dikinase regulatory protein [Fuchsiella alkaliacetigena]|uniref:pyruvate, water dikinase regulatory protein n=1 Tax=Fuchsiella alkaliacetigena TaxID=957042 RepID=UPI00200A2ABB|nr:pyruvate, water dikinase regulatory protein [Fuchsiella alkaliacetigena]MCK8824476.1 kinase/pyrophosphorylase [Fuchsiella alkaliacetigena]
MDKATVFIISDSIGETARQVVQAALSQFNSSVAVKTKKFSYVDSIYDIERIILEAKNERSILVFTLIDPEFKEQLITKAEEAQIEYVDIMGPMMESLSKVLESSPKLEAGLMRKLDQEYFDKIDAIEFTVKYDDRNDVAGIKKADIVLVGVSRTSKTPLSIYLAYRGYKVANIPLVPEVDPPDILFSNPRRKVIGLTINPRQLNEIRMIRLKGMGLNLTSDYASLKRINRELNYANRIMGKIGCPIIDVTNKSVEESANQILGLINK